jgi:hypothetical protein
MAKVQILIEQVERRMIQVHAVARVPVLSYLCVTNGVMCLAGGCWVDILVSYSVLGSGSYP